MSRIDITIVEPNTPVEATDLNADFTAFETLTTGAVDGVNIRDGGIDLPQFETLGNDIIEMYAASGNSGTESVNHTVNFGIPADVGPIPSLTPLEDGAGNPVFLDLSANPLVIDANQVIRIYYSADVQSVWTDPPSSTSPYREVTTHATLDRTENSGWCWALHLQMATTLTAGVPTGWTEVPHQGDFTRVIGLSAGAKLWEMAATSLISAWTAYDNGTGANGYSTNRDFVTGGFQPVMGAYFWPYGGAPLTIYGFRLVASGIYHVLLDGGVNCVVLDPVVATDASLIVTTANISVHVMKDR